MEAFHPDEAPGFIESHVSPNEPVRQIEGLGFVISAVVILGAKFGFEIDGDELTALVLGLIPLVTLARTMLTRRSVYSVASHVHEVSAALEIVPPDVAPGDA